MPVFDNSTILTRHSSVPISWYEEPRNWTERNQIYLTSSLDLLERAASEILARHHLTPKDIGTIVCVSTTGIATPSLEARLIDRMGFRPEVRRLPIFGLGCAGGVLGLARAASLARTEPDEIVLLLVVELCALWFRRDDLSKSNIVASALFGDGAAAMLVSCGGQGPKIVAAGEYTWPDSLGIMGWDVMPDGLSAIFSRDIPNLVRKNMRSVTSAFLARHGFGIEDIDDFVCHPGGAKVLDALEEAFGLVPGGMELARQVLRDHGNMSAATVLFVLEQALVRDAAPDRDCSGQRTLMTTLGPGFSTGFLVLEAP